MAVAAEDNPLQVVRLQSQEQVAPAVQALRVTQHGQVQHRLAQAALMLAEAGERASISEVREELAAEEKALKLGTQQLQVLLARAAEAVADALELKLGRPADRE